MSEEQITRIVDMILDGLLIDGAHHKQACLEEILCEIVTPERFTELESEYCWEAGIPA